MRRKLCLILFFLCGAQVAQDAFAGQVRLFAMDVVERLLLEVDVDSRSLTVVGSVGTPVQSMAFDPDDGYFYGMDVVSPRRLLRIDSTTGSASPVGPSLEDHDWGESDGIAYDAAGDRFFVSLTSTNELLEVRRDLGTITQIGLMDERSWALAFDTTSRRLFGVTHFTRSLVEIDISTGSQTLIGQPGGIGQVEGLSFNPDDGFLYAVLINEDFELARINPNTGAMTRLGSLGTDHFISGLAFTPEPTSLALLAFGTIAILRPTRRA